MMETIEANWLIFAVVLIIGLLVAWWLFGRATSIPRRREYKPDILDEGQGPAQRNQALIDAPPSVQIVPPPLSAGMAGIGEAVAIGAQDVIEEAEAQAPPEPAPPPTPRPAPPPAPAPAPKAIKAKTSPKPKAEPKPKPEPKAKAQPKPKAAPKPEPVATAAPELKPAPAPVATPEPAPVSPPPPPEPVVIAADDLGRIKGLGPKLQALLPELGLSTFAQIAALSEADLAALDPKLGPFAGRPVRDNWVEQAKFLAAGDVAGFEEKFGKV